MLIAAQGEHTAVVRDLTSHGGDIDVGQERAWTPLFAPGGHEEVMRMLVAPGASLTETRKGGGTVMCIAASIGNLVTIRRLRSLGARVNGGVTSPAAWRRNSVMILRFVCWFRWLRTPTRRRRTAKYRC
jgi:hypothetical protein